MDVGAETCSASSLSCVSSDCASGHRAPGSNPSGVLWSGGLRAASLCPGLGLPHILITSLLSRIVILSLHACNTSPRRALGGWLRPSIPVPAPLSSPLLWPGPDEDMQAHTCAHVCIGACTHMYVWVCEHVFIHVRMHVCVCICISLVTNSSKCICQRVCTWRRREPWGTCVQE